MARLVELWEHLPNIVKGGNRSHFFGNESGVGQIGIEGGL